MQLNGTYDVKLGCSFTDPANVSFMTLRCDFMPASVDRTKPGSIEVKDNKFVEVSLPNVASAGPGSTVFRGSARTVQKECVLVYNRRTGEMTLERILHAAQLKKTREEKPPEPIAAVTTASSVIPHGPTPPATLADRSGGQRNLPQGSSMKPTTVATDGAKKFNSHTLSSSSSSSSDGGGNSDGELNGNDSDTDFMLSDVDEHPPENNGGGAVVESDISDSSASSSFPADMHSKVTQRQHVITTDSQGKVVNMSSETITVTQSLHRTLVENDLKLSDSDSDSC